ncbi:hypothetical protein J6590_099954 [Homalodisca vitripennis]|nr:hypothetical protein J6590_099954 [Homalodisca vitripennis]
MQVPRRFQYSPAHFPEQVPRSPLTARALRTSPLQHLHDLLELPPRAQPVAQVRLPERAEHPVQEQERCPLPRQPDVDQILGVSFLCELCVNIVLINKLF